MEELVLIPYRKGNKWGYSDFDKNLLIPCEFDWVTEFNEDRAIVCKVNDRRDYFGVIDPNGNLICDFIYDWIAHFQNGFAAVVKEKKVGFIDKNGSEKIPTIYKKAFPFTCNRAAVSLKKKLLFIDTEGNKITEPIYDICDSFKDGYAVVHRDGLYGVIDLHGYEVVPSISTTPVEFSEGFAAISLSNPDASFNLTAQKLKDSDLSKLTIIEKDGKVIFEDRFGTESDRGSIELALKNQCCGYVNIDLETVIGFNFEKAFPFSEGIACVKVGGKFGFIDKNGGWIAKPIYENAGDYKEGLARVRKNKKWGYLNKSGEVVIGFKYTDAYDFNEGHAKVIKIDPEYNQGNKRSGLIQKDGRELFFNSYLDMEEDEKECSYAEVYHDRVENSYIALRDLDGSFFVLNAKTGDEFHLPEKCIEVFPFNKEGIAEVKLHGFKNKILRGFVSEYQKFWEDF